MSDRVHLERDCQPAVVTAEDYARAERFLPKNVAKLLFQLELTPNWIGPTDAFWYRMQTQNGNWFHHVNPLTGIRRAAFDHIRLAAALSRHMKRAYVHTALPFQDIAYLDDQEAIVFSVEGQRLRCDLNTYALTPHHADQPAIGWQEIPSPDGKWAAFVRDHNLYLRSVETGTEVALTQDGVEGYHYAEPLANPLISAGLLEPGPWLRPLVLWSPDSKKLLSYRIDVRGVGECYLVQSVPPTGSKRPVLHRYTYPLPGDEQVPRCEPVVIDVSSRTVVKAKMDPVVHLYYGGPRGFVHWTEGDQQRILLMRRHRGYHKVTLEEIDPVDGAVRPLICEESPTAVDYYPPQIVDNGKEIVWHSQQDGWAHLYLHDGQTGELKQQITSGPWMVREIKHIDQQARVVYFTASGLDSARDPYYQHLYRIGLDGRDLMLLTPEDAEHQITFCPSGSFFLDRYSRVDLAPATVLRDTEGTLVLELEQADLTAVFATGWKFPERFCVKARDGMTDIYGTMIRPSNFDPNQQYPVIEANYSGPQTIRTPKAFADGGGSRQFWQDQALAELGFIVVSVDGLGMAFRSKAFQDYSYRNLADAGLEDHIVAFRQLADRYPYLDLSRVGIFGGSAGGYAATQAILAQPDFYKVCVAWAGNHDHRIDKASWIERYMGLPVADHYEQQANPHLAANLRGKLLLMHGEMDENVPPAATLQLVDALVKANKDFDLFILPNAQHADGYHPYITRKRWDYFVRHLLGLTPPQEYLIRE